MTQITTIDTNNFAAMASAMGIDAEGGSSKKQSSTLARLRINHSPILGSDKILVKGGTYKLDIPDGPTYYGTSVKMRPYLQRFMYKKFVMGSGGNPNRYVKTVMANNLNIDLKDNDGGFNCGKPAGYIADFKSLPEKTQELIKQIKRVRVVLGTVELVDAVDANGNPAEVPETAFIWEIENRDAYKDVGQLFTKLNKMKRYPVQHIMTGNTQERKLPNGNSFYLPIMSLDLTNTLDLTDKEQETFGDFMSWVENYNEYIINAYAEKATSKADAELDELEIDDVVDIDVDDEVEVA
jgi:hypothetical protein